ncbi:MAG: PilN domain-containing protein [Nitrospirae bacterium]|nr:PilN domain-containing protein [Nitrospirota bacterium]MBF0536082.1 PilN domain-containing protein [Nitrospirota bacterium]MBF0617957.1 PilN domain-containing protein [Nitrospirota bacterium]
MIKINLLPLDGKARRRKKAAAPVPMALVLLIVVFLVSSGAALYTYFYLSGKVTKMKKDKAHKDILLKDLNDKLGEVKKLGEKQKKIEDNIKVLGQLTAAQSLPVKVLDDLCKLLPENVWFTKLDITGNLLKIEGKALSNDDVVIFVENLKQSSRFKDTVLRRAVLGSTVEGINSVDFAIDTTINQDEPKTDATQGVGKQ